MKERKKLPRDKETKKTKKIENSIPKQFSKILNIQVQPHKPVSAVHNYV